MGRKYFLCQKTIEYVLTLSEIMSVQYLDISQSELMLIYRYIHVVVYFFKEDNRTFIKLQVQGFWVWFLSQLVWKSCMQDYYFSYCYFHLRTGVKDLAHLKLSLTKMQLKKIYLQFSISFAIHCEWRWMRCYETVAKISLYTVSLSKSHICYLYLIMKNQLIEGTMYNHTDDSWPGNRTTLYQFC